MADAALNRLEVDTMGLDAMDRRYLMMIADVYRGGPVGVETLAAGLSEPRDTVEEVIEPYLIQLGLIARTARGRMRSEEQTSELQYIMRISYAVFCLKQKTQTHV